MICGKIFCLKAKQRLAFLRTRGGDFTAAWEERQRCEAPTTTAEQSAMQISFVVTLRQTEKLNRIGVFEDPLSLGIHLSHRWRDFCGGEHGALEKDNPERTSHPTI